MGKLLPIKLPPGMYRNGTEYESKGRWFDGNMVRWENGTLKPMGGWQALIAGGAAFSGMARGGIAWQDNSGFKHILIGTNTKLYHGTGGTFTDQTPTSPALVTGRQDSILGAGYGAGAYGKQTYGTVRTGSSTLQLNAATWSFDTFGQTAVFCLTSDNNIWQFDPGTGLVTVVANSPKANAVFVTNEQYVVALGASLVGREIAWCDTGNDTVWAAASTNAAGNFNLQTGGACMAGARVGTQNLIWTNADVHLLNFIGSPGIYAPIKIGSHAGLIGPNAYVVTDVAYWWSEGGFFRYNGIVEPLPCDVQDYIYANLNTLQVAKIFGFQNSRFNEVGWFFPSNIGSNTEIDSYVIYNYKMGVWYFGIGSLMARTTWLDRGVFPWPLAVDSSGIIYEMEQGYLANGVTRVGQIFAQSGPAEIGDGDKIIYSNLLLPDKSTNPGSIQLTAKTRFAPAGPVSSLGPWPLVPNAEGYVGVRFSGRQASIRIDETADTDWSIGQLRFDVAGGGGR